MKNSVSTVGFNCVFINNNDKNDIDKGDQSFQQKNWYNIYSTAEMDSAIKGAEDFDRLHYKLAQHPNPMDIIKKRTLNHEC